MLFTLEDAQYIGLKLKAVLKYISKCPAGATITQLEKEFPVSRVGNHFSSILELAVAADLLKDEWEGNVQVFRIKKQA
jgi:hypothetical protein